MRNAPIQQLKSKYLTRQHFNRSNIGFSSKKNGRRYNGVKKNACLFPPGIDPSNHQIINPKTLNSNNFRKTQILFVVSFFVILLVVYCLKDALLSLILGFHAILIIQYIYHYFNRIPKAFD